MQNIFFYQKDQHTVVLFSRTSVQSSIVACFFHTVSYTKVSPLRMMNGHLFPPTCNFTELHSCLQRKFPTILAMLTKHPPIPQAQGNVKSSQLGCWVVVDVLKASSVHLAAHLFHTSVDYMLGQQRTETQELNYQDSRTF